MPDGKYYRTQAQLCATLALAADDEKTAARYNELAIEYLARADEVEPSAPDFESAPPIPAVPQQQARDATGE